MKMKRGMRVVSAGVLMAAMSACQVTALRDEYGREAPVRLVAMQPENGADLRLTFAFRAPVAVHLMISTNAAEEHVSAARLTGAPGGEIHWVDVGAARAPGVRYYRLRVDTGGGPWLSAEEWALFVQAREAGQRYLISVPVELGQENRLDGMLGQQLAIGMHAGVSTNDADHLQYLDARGDWQTAFLQTRADGAPFWWDAQTGADCTAVIEPGRALWIARGSGAGHLWPHGMMWGRTITRPYPVSFRVDTVRATPFGLPWSRPVEHRRAVVSASKEALTDPLGFGPVGSGGKTSDARRPDEVGDQIWVWQGNEWQHHYWLMGHVGPAWDGRWWDNRARDFADFALEPGVGYYYRHRPNRWGGTNFVWAPPVSSKNVDN